jgi:phospholipase C
VAALAMVAAACTAGAKVPERTRTPTIAGTPSADVLALARQKIKHVVVIMQENRSFDSFFGTFPGADGIPMENGVPTSCSPNSVTDVCVKPFHDPNLINLGGGHDVYSANRDIDAGYMDGFVSDLMRRLGCLPTSPRHQRQCSYAVDRPDVMGWHDARELPNYWTWAKHFVLLDHLFEPNLG